MNNQIYDKIFDIIFNNSTNDFEISEKEYDLDNISGVEIIIEPEDSESLKEVNSFIVKEAVIGDIVWRGKRKIERP